MSQNPIDLAKIAEIMSHLRDLFQIFNEEMSYFDEYLEGMLKFDLDLVLLCVRRLKRETEFLKPKGASHGEQSQSKLKKPPVFKKMPRRKAANTKTTSGLLGDIRQASREYANRRS